MAKGSACKNCIFSPDVETIHHLITICTLCDGEHPENVEMHTNVFREKGTENAHSFTRKVDIEEHNKFDKLTAAILTDIILQHEDLSREFVLGLYKDVLHEIEGR